MPVYGVDGKDIKYLAARCHMRLAEGRWPAKNQPEVVMSRAWAATKKLKLGQTFQAGDRYTGVLLRPKESLAARFKREYQWLAEAVFPKRTGSIQLLPGAARRRRQSPE